MGAECNAEQTIVMTHALRNTTSLLRGLVAGNLTNISTLLTGAYSEVSAISSLLLDTQCQACWLSERLFCQQPCMLYNILTMCSPYCLVIGLYIYL